MDVSAAQQAHDRLRAAQHSDGPLSIKQRRALLRRLERALGARKDDLIAAAAADARGRPAREILHAELWPSFAASRLARKHLKEWAQPEAVELPALFYKPGRARVDYQPLGVVGIISPRSAPIRLTLSPLVSAIAAGNRVIIKPPEHTPQTNALLASVLSESLGDAIVAVLTGDTAAAEALCSQPLDHLWFAGSPAAGRAVAAAASAQPIPVTLHLGGKSPALIHPSYPIATAAHRIMLGKLAAAGQSGLAPDHVLCPADKVDAFVAAYTASASKRYPTLADNDSYASIVDDQHRWRLSSWVDEAVSAGATAHTINPAGEDLADSPKMAPVVLTGVAADSSVMREEVFGPVLVVVPYTDLAQAIASIRAQPHRPRLYCFDNRRRRALATAAQVAAGGVTINSCAVHGLDHLLPGGFAGFEAFSRQVPAYAAGRLSLRPLLHRPMWAGLMSRLVRLLIR